MKKVIVAASIVSVMTASTALALTYTGASNKAGDGLVLSKHNMQSYDASVKKDAEGRVCAFCHTPHHALKDTTVDGTGKALGYANYLPLWSHEITNQINFNAYQSPTVLVGGNESLTGATILCMSCHDGIVAIDQHYNIAGNVKLANDDFGGTAIGLADANGAASLGNDHPIGFMYADAIEKHKGDLAAANTPWKGTKTSKTIGDGLAQGWFTCATCHDVHNKDSVPNSYAGASRNYFLYGDNNNSDFCTTCHLK